MAIWYENYQLIDELLNTHSIQEEFLNQPDIVLK